MIQTIKFRHFYNRHDFTLFKILISGMSSLYTTLALTCIRLLIVKRHANTWLEQKGPKSNNSRYVVMLVWLSSVAVSTPPIFGLGKIDQSMVGVR